MPDFRELADTVRNMSAYKRPPNDIQFGGEHYRNKSIQPWEYMESVWTEEQFKGYLIGNVIKYISRFQDKGGLLDLEKCSHYLDKLKQVW